MSQIETRLNKILDKHLLRYFNRVAIKANKTMLNNFDQEKDVDGNNFAPLKSSTIKDRIYRNYGAGPILKRTRKLRNSIKVTPVLKKATWIIDSVDYGEDLHDGRSNMQPRRILDFPKELYPGGSENEKILSTINDDLIGDVIKIINELGAKLR